MTNKKQTIFLCLFAIFLILYLKFYCNPSSFWCEEPHPSWLMTFAEFGLLCIMGLSSSSIMNIISLKKINYKIILPVIAMLLSLALFIYFILNNQIF